MQDQQEESDNSGGGINPNMYASTTMYGSLQNPYSIPGSSSLNVSTIAPLFGVQPQQRLGGVKEPDFLYYDQRGRGWFERTCYNAGTTCLAGMGVGGVYGLVDGWRTSPSKKWKIRMNSVLNKTGRYSSRVGNAVGILALMYSGIEWSVEHAELENRVGFGHELLTPAVSAVLTGVLYKSTSGSPKAIIIAGGLGGALALAAYGVKSLGIHSSKGLLFF